jgi:hypothetical protein
LFDYYFRSHQPPKNTKNIFQKLLKYPQLKPIKSKKKKKKKKKRKKKKEKRKKKKEKSITSDSNVKASPCSVKRSFSHRLSR